MERLLSLRMNVGLVDHHAMGGKLIPPSSLVGYKHVLPGELVMNRMRAAVGLFGAASSEGLVSPDYAIFSVRPELKVEYAVSLFKTPTMTSLFRLESRGLGTGESGFLRLYSDRFGVLRMPLPPPEEQATIVRFLDHANRRIDQFIRSKRKLIALLNEQKQAIVHGAVTRGLSATTKTKETGSRWFPSAPSPWEVLPLARVITAAIDGPHFSPTYLDKGVPFLSARNIKADRWSLDDAKFISEADYEEFSRRVRPEVGDVLYTKGGTTGVARAVDLTFKFQVWVHVAVLKLARSRVDPHFLAYALNSPRCYEQSQLFTRGATNQDLGLGRMKRIELPVPPTIEEQQSIVRYLDAETQIYTNAIRSSEREIDLAREYRTRLVADVVTGQFDVRAAAASLSDSEPDAAPVESSDDEEEDIDDSEAA